MDEPKYSYFNKRYGATVKVYEPEDAVFEANVTFGDLELLADLDSMSAAPSFRQGEFGWRKIKPKVW